MVPSEPTWHVSRVQKRVSKFVNFKVQKVQKPELYGLTVNWVFLYALSAFRKYISPLWTNFLHWLRPLGKCGKYIRPRTNIKNILVLGRIIKINIFLCLKSRFLFLSKCMNGIEYTKENWLTWVHLRYKYYISRRISLAAVIMEEYITRAAALPILSSALPRTI